MKCGYIGCKNQAAYCLKLTAGKKQPLYVCSVCAPEWVKKGESSKYYEVSKL